jgi:hypothetical protein
MKKAETDAERGTVRQTPEGQIRWTTFSIFHGEERWRSEGIQVGGLRSARGVLGNWFDKYENLHDRAVETLLTLWPPGITMFTDPLDRLRSGKKVTSLKRRRTACDVNTMRETIWCTVDCT